jgi:hypothetical protein
MWDVGQAIGVSESAISQLLKRLMPRIREAHGDAKLIELLGGPDADGTAERRAA